MKKGYSLNTTPANEQRRPENARDDDWIREFLSKATVGHIATRWDEQPFITPTTFWYNQEFHTIYFHSNIVGRIRANVERHRRACFEACEAGRLLPSNIALEFTIQYASVIAFGNIEVITSETEKLEALYGLISKYFPGMKAGQEYRPITPQELARTSAYAFRVESWSGKENWPARAKQSLTWRPLE